ncbi:pyridoxamine 5'-phosphate oxidase-domain-containing protein [Xylariaceae sp. FL1651]|nr:pyridoxamine 5'-phosphate oxidase-domain-containing protein [Xylariaceae sp. FL1651]
MTRITRVIVTLPFLSSSSSPSQRLSQLTTHLRRHHTHHAMPTATSSAAAPWRSLFLSHIESMESPEFVLSTVRRNPSPPNPSHRRSSGFTAAAAAAAPPPPPPYFPRARTCIFRGLWACLPMNPKNDAPLNPPGVWESDLLTFTTDARMDKMEELWMEEDEDEEGEGGQGLLDRSHQGRRVGGGDPSSPTTTKVGEELWEEGLLARGKGEDKDKDKDKNQGGEQETEKDKERKGKEKRSRHDRLRGSGGGAPVEAVFWARGPGVQWRVRGRAYVLAPDVDRSAEGREVAALLRGRMRRPASGSSPDADPKGEGEDRGGGGEWSFAREITAHFGNLSPAMRGTFRNPPPGRPVSSSLPLDNGLALGQKVTDLEDPVARANFRVVVIVPDALDQADLSDPEHPRRWLYTYVGGGGSSGGDNAHGKEEEGVVRQGEWEKVEVWP